MPVILVDRLPLPNLKVYTAGSVVLLAVAVYHAVGMTSDPSWRANATLQKAGDDGGEVLAAVEAAANGTRNITEQVVDVVTFMMQEPLCMWTLINMCYCSLALFAFVLQRLVFGSLRVAEAQRVKDKLWNFVFYKFIFVFGVVNVQYMDEVLLWCSWFTLVGFLHLLAHLCKDRFEYLSSSARGSGWAHARLAALVAGVACCAGALLGVAGAVGLPASRHTFAFMAAECVLVLLSALHVLARYVLALYEADAAGPAAYYTHLAFDALSLVVELGDVVHMVWYSRLLVSMPSLVLLLQLRHLLHQLQARLRKHRLYTALATHMSLHYPMASKEEVEKNQDNCAICWEPMKEARKLPCSHLFHNSCLCQWVQQDASCPTCRRALRAPAPPAAPLASPAAPLRALVAGAEPLPRPRPANLPNHLFHFDGSRYVSWLPSFSVEVTRVRAPPPRLDALARQVQQLFPGYPLGVLTADLAATQSADATVNNILEGRLPPPPPPVPPRPEEPAATSSHSISAAATFRRERSAPPPPTRDQATSTTRVLTDDTDGDEVFRAEASEREAQLQRRKEDLLSAARRRYLARRQGAHAAPPPPS